MKTMFLYFVILFLAFWVTMMSKKKMMKKAAGNGKEFDERQVVARGMAYKYGFFTAMIYFSVNAFVVAGLHYQWCTYEINIGIGICLSIIVFAAVCIWKDAYVSLGMSGTYYYGLLVLIGGLNVVIGMNGDNYPESQVINDQIANISMNMIVGSTLIIVALIGLVKHILSRREEE